LSIPSTVSSSDSVRNATQLSGDSSSASIDRHALRAGGGRP
jgi:hypothetical protein